MERAKEWLQLGKSPAEIGDHEIKMILILLDFLSSSHATREKADN